MFVDSESLCESVGRARPDLEHLSLARGEITRHPFQRPRHAGVGSQPNREATLNSASLTSDPRDRVCDFDG